MVCVQGWKFENGLTGLVEQLQEGRIQIDRNMEMKCNWVTIAVCKVYDEFTAGV